MKIPVRWSLVLALAGLATSQAHAVGQLADVVVVDRDSGAVLPVHRQGGDWWIEGRPDARYAIRIRNASGERLLAVTSVDGVNVVTGETAAVGQNGYVYDAWRSWDITGWRKTDDQVAAFEFTTVPRSYAARTGRRDNVGVIGVALFREKTRLVPLELSPPVLEEAVPVAKAGGAAADASSLAQSNEARRERAAPASPVPAPGLGTGHGRRENSTVTRVDFERAQSRPNEVIRLRYDSRANLVAMGVLPSPLPRPRRPEAFPSGPQLGYVPDP